MQVTLQFANGIVAKRQQSIGWMREHFKYSDSLHSLETLFQQLRHCQVDVLWQWTLPHRLSQQQGAVPKRISKTTSWHGC